MGKYILTIVITAYNSAKTIKAAVDSIKHTECFGKIEVIIVNDGSTDNSQAVIEKIAKGVTNIVVINQDNRGHGGAVNSGISRAHGKYFRVLDGDDAMNGKNLDLLIKELENENSDIIFSNYFEKNKQTKTVSWSDKAEFKNIAIDDALNGTEGIMLPFITVKTDLIKKIKLTEKVYYDDQEYDFWCTLYAATASYISAPIYIYNVGSSDQSISHASMAKHIKDHEKICLNLLGFYEKHKGQLGNIRSKIVEKRIVGLCYLQYRTAIWNKKSRQDFCAFDSALKKYPSFYKNKNIAGRRIIIHRLTKGALIK
ncbi:MAG: glycosyltransferase family 2 protein [Candidatus Saccharibacteria bacterium]|nr:glycosyltransferase family 2 protein [Candidatus Saccharibacteria bacterium]